MRINTSKVRLVKSSFGGCELLLIAPFLFFFSFFKGRVLVSLIKVMTFQENHFQNT